MFVPLLTRPVLFNPVWFNAVLTSSLAWLAADQTLLDSLEQSCSLVAEPTVLSSLQIVARTTSQPPLSSPGSVCKSASLDQPAPGLL